MTDTKETSKTERHALLSSVIGCAFVAIADRYMNLVYHECDTKEEAVRFLEYGSDSGEHMDIAVIDCNTNEMIWYKNYLGKEECQQRVDGFIAKHSL